jgi:RNA polymerase sigma-70 factor (ECF subfamily)
LEICDYFAVQEVVEGYEYDFSEVFNKYKKLVYAVAHKFFNDFNDIEDICQEVFLRVFKYLKMFNPEYKLSTWISAITKNLCKDKIRKQKHLIESIDIKDLDSCIIRNDTTPENVLIDKELLLIIRSVIMELPEKYRQPITLYYFEGLTYNELAETLNVPMTIVKNRIYRAKIILKKKLARTCID